MKKIFISILFMFLGLLTYFSYKTGLDWRTEVVLSGSMEPTLKTGSLILVRRLLPNQYKVGDVITFQIPGSIGQLVTHRITDIYPNSNGVLVLNTKGDFNTNGDPWVLSLGNIVGKPMLAIPYFGYAVSFLKTIFGFLVFSLAYWLWVVYPILKDLFGRCKDSKKRGSGDLEPPMQIS